MSTNFSLSTQIPSDSQKDSIVLDPNCQCFLASCKICQDRLFQPISHSIPFSTPDTSHENRFSRSVPTLPIVPDGFELFYRTPSKGYYDNDVNFFHEIPEICPISNLQTISIENPTVSNNTASQPSVDIHILQDNNCGENYIPTSNFRLQNQKILLTYKTHLPKDLFKQWFIKEVSGVKQIEIAHEVGKDGGVDYDHSHVLVDFGRNFQTTNVRKFDYNGIHPHIKKIKNKTHWDRCCNYLAKEDPANSHLKTEINLVTAVFNADSRSEALLNNVKKFSDVSGVLQLYDLKPKDKLVVPTPDRKWSLELISFLESNPPDDRHIIWIYDEIGGGGKSRIVKWLCNEFPSKYRFSRGAPIRDAATDIHNAIKTGWNQHCYLYDLPRAMEDKKFYEPLEDIKDGMLSVTKYNSQSLMFRSPHVVVMANFLPNIDNLSEDRWWVFEVSRDKQNWRRLSSNELVSMYKAQLNKKKNASTDTLLTIV
jgi:hypothetical protein